MESLQAFLLHGEFVSTPFGVNKTDFFQKFGKPSTYFTVSESDKRITFAKYGIVEFYFTEVGNYEKLDGIVVKPNLEPSDNIRFTFQEEWLIPGLTYREICHFLSHVKIEFVETKDEINQHILETKSGIIFYFEENDGNLKDSRLDKIAKYKLMVK